MGKSEQKMKTLSVSENAWKKLSQKKIYFGHMSVGYNIMDGIKDIMKNNPAISLNIQETADIRKFNNGVFAHSQNGENGKPKTKIDAFVKTMDSGLAKQVNIAFFKFCYVDFTKDTDVADLFRYYTSAMEALKKRYPTVVIMHVTAPVTTEGELLGVKTRIKDFIKRILGKETNQQQNITGNFKRCEFNALLRKKYDGNHIIDLEQFESTRPDGSLYTSTQYGSSHSVMVPAYSFDGGHLNERGRVWVADGVLTRLSELQ